MNLLFEAMADIGLFFNEKGWHFCVIGGLAIQRWGEPRSTQDVDITLLTGFGNEAHFVQEILEKYSPRISSAHDFALENRVLLITTSHGVEIDISLGALPFEEEMVKRAILFEFSPGILFPLCTAEDLLVMKAFAGRPRDWSDIEGIIVRQRNKLDTTYVFNQLEFLCALKEDDLTIPRIQDILKKKK